MVKVAVAVNSKTQGGTIPLAASSLRACAFLESCIRPMPRSMFGALEN